MSKLKLNSNTTYNGLLDFDGNDVVRPGGGSPTSPYVPDVTGNRTIEFKMWLDTSIWKNHSSFGSGIVNWTQQNASDYFVASFYDSTMRVYTNESGSGSASINLDESLMNRILQFEIVKSRDAILGGKVDSIKINGITQSLTSITGIIMGIHASEIGEFSTNLYDAALWDIKINSDSELMHYWKGYPAGDQNSAWLDLAGDPCTLNGTVGGTPTTRNISGLYGNNKLKLGGNILTGLLDFTGPIGDGGNDAYIDFSSLPDVTGEKTITFNMYLDSSPNIIVPWINMRTSGSIDCLRMESVKTSYPLDSGYVLEIGVSDASSKRYDLMPHIKQILNCEIKKTDGSISYFKINENAQTYSIGGSYSNSSEDYIGRSATVRRINHGAIWDIKIYDESLVLEHYWKGYPNGNTDAAWVDQVGSIDGELKYTSAPGIRNISVGGIAANRLKIVPE